LEPPHGDDVEPAWPDDGDPAGGETGVGDAETAASDDGSTAADERASGRQDGAAWDRPDDSEEPDGRESGRPGREDDGTGAGAGDAATDDEGADDHARGVESDGRPADDHARTVAPGEQRTLDGAAVSDERSFDSLPPLRVLGQYDDTYVVAAAPDGLVLVDQHAADERVQYERLRERFEGEVAAQSLAEPVAVALTAGEAELVEDYRAALADLGFEVARTGERSLAVSAVPAVLAETLDADLVGDVLSAALSADGGDRPVAARADDLLADLACRPAVTGNTSLTEGSVVDLLAALDDCENPYACPHGRPVVVSLDDEEIAARFERDYPGHGARRD
jgi:DNA mismatch repair protein MutL